MVKRQISGYLFMLTMKMCQILLIFLFTTCITLSSSFSVTTTGVYSAADRRIKRHVTIYEWEENSSSSNPESTFDAPSDILSENDTKILEEEYTTIAEHLTCNKDREASLARLAVAFSPPDRSVKLEDIHRVHIIEVRNDHIEISAVVCDEADCLTLLVPVTFPHDCNVSDDESSDSMEECVLDNIFELDVEAQEVLRQRQIEKQLEASDQERELLNALYSSDDIHLPSWWKPPVNDDMVEECQKIKGILNQDEFRSQVKALASDGLAFCDDGDLFEIHRAAVCSIGPAGFYFRAIATKKMQSAKKNVSYTILEIPNKAFDGEISEASELRAAVLGIVASVE